MVSTKIDFHPDLRAVSTSPRREECFLPAATIQVHASNLLLLDSGELLCAWFGGSQEGVSDIYIWLSRLAPGAKTWTPPQQVSDDPSRSEQNPVLFQDPATKNLWIFYTAQEAGAQNKCVVRRRVSTDLGRTWGAVAELFPERGVFVRQPVTVVPQGEKKPDLWVLPVFYCRAGEGEEWVGNDDIAGVRYSSDGGQTWGEKLVPESRGCVHMNIRPTPWDDNSKFVAVFRSRWADHVYLSRSDDCINWSPPQPTSLPNPNSGICLAELPRSKRLAIVYNDSAATPGMKTREGLYDDIESGDGAPKLKKQAVVGDKAAIWGTPRSKLTLGLSDDGGRTWRTRLLEDGDGFCLTNNSMDKINRELSYPSIAVAPDGTIHVAYTFWRQRIKYVRITEDFV